jgi:hypothetical protein
MASVELNRLLMRAVSDSAFRTKFLDDPSAAAKEGGASAATLKEVGELNVQRLRTQFDHLSRVSSDLLGSLVSAGHSSDHLDRSNIHDNDGHIHDKAGNLTLGSLVSDPAPFRALDASAVRDALRDPAILKEIESNPAIKAALKNAVK